VSEGLWDEFPAYHTVHIQWWYAQGATADKITTYIIISVQEGQFWLKAGTLASISELSSIHIIGTSEYAGPN
jgi:hypothetical protein